MLVAVNTVGTVGLFITLMLSTNMAMSNPSSKVLCNEINFFQIAVTRLNMGTSQPGSGELLTVHSEEGGAVVGQSLQVLPEGGIGEHDQNIGSVELVGVDHHPGHVLGEEEGAGVCQ